MPEWKEPAHYRVDIVMRRGADTVVMRRFTSAGRVRWELAAAGTDMVMIERPDRGVIWIVPPPAPGHVRAYLEHKLPSPAPASAGAAAGLPADLTVRLLGPETVDGRRCVKYELAHQGRTATVWADAETGAPVRLRHAEMSVDWQNYSVGPQPAALFEPPPGYERQVMPDFGDASVMAGMAGMTLGQAALGTAGGFAAQAAGQAGAAAGMALGGPIGAVIGQYLGQYAAGWLVGKGQQAVMPGPSMPGRP
ncbi:MAG TPA: hypothetical protein VNK50_06095 [Calidithermus sp.]|nr:hypothetical protein [Calidithermus sp.]